MKQIRFKEKTDSGGLIFFQIHDKARNILKNSKFIAIKFDSKVCGYAEKYGIGRNGNNFFTWYNNKYKINNKLLNKELRVICCLISRINNI